MVQQEPKSGMINVRFRIREFGVPPIHDALVLGKKSPIGCVAIRKALSLLQGSPFEHIEFDDDVISDILVRSSILRRLPRDKLITVIVQRVKPLMVASEILHLDLEPELFLEVQV